MAQRRELPPETLGLRIRLARTRLRWTLADLALATRITESMLSRYERDAAEPSPSRLVLIARALGTRPDLLLGFDDEVGGTRASLQSHSRKRTSRPFLAAVGA